MMSFMRYRDQTGSVCVGMSLSRRSCGADGGSERTCSDRRAIDAQADPPLTTTTSSSSLHSIKGHMCPLTSLESTVIGGKCSQWPSRNNAQWSAGGGRGGRLCGHEWKGGEWGRYFLPPLHPPGSPSALSLFLCLPPYKGSRRRVSQGTRKLIFPSGEPKNWAQWWKYSDPWPERTSVSQAWIALLQTGVEEREGGREGERKKEEEILVTEKVSFTLRSTEKR